MISKKLGQQEMVGFVLIIALVMVALVIFIVISVRQAPEEVQNFEVENMLDVMLAYTTGCAIVFEPQYDTIEDLVKSCYNNQKCSNINVMACDYLNSTLGEVMGDLVASESTLSAYQVDVLHRDSEDIEEGILRVAGGNCSGGVAGAGVPIVTSSGDLIVRLRICKED